MEIRLPFEGFYNSSLQESLEHGLEIHWMDDHGDIRDHTAYEDSVMTTDWNGAHNEVATIWVQHLARELCLDMKFVELDSPKYYNYRTDYIYASIEDHDVDKMFSRVFHIKENRRHMDDVAKEEFTSRSGFVSFYDPDYRTWGSVATWDYHQLCALFEAYIRSIDLELGDLEEDFIDTINDYNYEIIEKYMTQFPTAKQLGIAV